MRGVSRAKGRCGHVKDCGEYQREISLLIDGELAEPQKTGLLRHIGQCDECRRVYDAFNAISLTRDLVWPRRALRRT